MVPESTTSTATPELGETALRELALGIAAGTAEREVLRARHDALTVRAPVGGGTVILKLWKRPGLAGWLRRVTASGNLDREWRVLGRLHRRGLFVPVPLGRLHFAQPREGYTDAVIVSDLGRCALALDAIDEAAQNGRSDEIIAIEDEVLAFTAAFVKAGVLDRDHHLVNLLITPERRVARIDFELARTVRVPGLFPERYAEMLGTLMSTYVFAVQPHLEHADRFAARLAERLTPSPSVLRRTGQRVVAALQRQATSVGVETRWDPPW